MRNILSYQNGVFSGEEIMNWAKHQVENKTSHKRNARYILNHYKLLPQRQYGIKTSFFGTGCGEVRHRPLIYKI